MEHLETGFSLFDLLYAMKDKTSCDNEFFSDFCYSDKDGTQIYKNSDLFHIRFVKKGLSHGNNKVVNFNVLYNNGSFNINGLEDYEKVNEFFSDCKNIFLDINLFSEKYKKYFSSYVMKNNLLVNSSLFNKDDCNVWSNSVSDYLLSQTGDRISLYEVVNEYIKYCNSIKNVFEKESGLYDMYNRICEVVNKELNGNVLDLSDIEVIKSYGDCYATLSGFRTFGIYDLKIDGLTENEYMIKINLNLSKFIKRTKKSKLIIPVSYQDDYKLLNDKEYIEYLKSYNRKVNIDNFPIMPLQYIRSLSVYVLNLYLYSMKNNYVPIYILLPENDFINYDSCCANDFDSREYTTGYLGEFIQNIIYKNKDYIKYDEVCNIDTLNILRKKYNKYLKPKFIELDNDKYISICVSEDNLDRNIKLEDVTLKVYNNDFSFNNEYNLSSKDKDSKKVFKYMVDKSILDKIYRKVGESDIIENYYNVKNNIKIKEDIRNKINEEIYELFRKIKEKNLELERLDKSFDDRVKIKLDEKTIFRNTEYGYKVINEHIKDMLEYIDLSGVSFEDVLVSGVNFKGCNPLLLDPQKVWNKDLSNTVFYNDLIYINDFPFDYFTDFNGVNISGALIESNGKTLNFDGAIKENKVIKNKVLFKKK